ncbi:helix-turn-helix transcriptional regulator [Lutimonas halocynthiae]|uniref:helix-turn-helix transcriptional regulator n=1 Tax=Lutimonas halocynthiae TaxID=1446477 RepID=UPI0025B2CF55|nr:helix-turn-helix transcriptional regulator [Lutimonas halocynthiae]MDN3642934.1 helix-turn-helix transcriptional regulator [Lutimonas halocynthiae]
MKKDIKPTLLDFAILGLIQDQPLSGYGIRKVFEETAMGNYSNSPGTIYPAIKRLEKFELAEKVLQKDTAKTRFQITQKGLLRLKEWLIQPIEKKEVEKKTDELLLRFAFMETLVNKEQKIIFLHSFQDLLKTYIQDLQTFYSNESNNMPLHARLAFQHGIESNKTTLKWCKNTISVLT